MGERSTTGDDAQAASAGGEVLVVGAASSARAALCAALAAGGHTVLVVAEQREALDSAIERPPDLVVVDELPEAERGELCRRLRADPRTLEVPLICVGSAEPAVVIEAYEAGVSDWIARPCAADELRARAARQIERRLVRRGLAISEAAYRSLTEHCPMGIWHIDTAGATRYANPAMLAMLQLDDLGQLAGCTFAEFFTRASRERMAREHAKRRRNVASSYEVVLVGARGRELDVRISGAPVLDEDHRLSGLIGSFVDVTESKQTIALLEQTTAELKRASSAKSAFLAQVGHELRTPLNAIIGYSELLEEQFARGVETSTVIDDLRTIHGAGHHLRGLIDQLLDLSKAEAGRLEAQLTTFEVAPLLDEVRRTILPLAQRSENAFGVEVEDQLGEMRSDRTKLKQSLINLLGNACKFTERGVIELAARRAQRGDTSWVLFSVSDSGIGIADELRERIFEPFFQVDAASSRRGGGSGLGLAITRELCQLLGGELTVDSVPGEGTTFTIALPDAS